jgi:hypothetical protein
MQVDMSMQTEEGTPDEWNGARKQKGSQQGPETKTELKEDDVECEWKRIKR